MENHAEIRDSALLARAAYFATEVEIKDYLKAKGHRFTGGVTCSNLAKDNGHFVLAELTLNGGTTTYLAIRGSISLEDWGTNFQAWPTLQDMGMVHAGWYTRMLHLPKQLLLQRIREGQRVVVCGHSLGAAVAQLLTVSMLQSFTGDSEEEKHRSNIMCYSFSGPMVVTSGGAEQLNNHFKSNFANFIHPSDVVPKVFSFAQTTLKELSDQPPKQTLALPVATMVQYVADPTLYKARTVESLQQMVTNGLAVLAQSTAARAALQYRPIGYYYRVDARSGGGLSPMNDTEVNAVMAWDGSDVSWNALIAHDLERTYVEGVLVLLNPSSGELASKTEPKSMPLPKPLIHQVTLHRSGKEVLVRIFGSNLYAIKRVVSSQLPLCKLNHTVTPEALVSAEQLSFRVPRSDAPARGVGSPTTSAKFLAATGVCWNDDVKFQHIPVEIKDIHRLELLSLQELVTVGMYLLLFMSREKGHSDNQRFSDLRKLLMEVFVTVPAWVFFTFDSPIATYCFDNEKYTEQSVALLKSDPRGRSALDEYIKQGRAFCDRQKGSSAAETIERRVAALSEAVKRQGTAAVEPVDILTFLIECHGPPLTGREGGLRVLLDILVGPLKHTRSALQLDLTADNYQAFLGTLEVSISSITTLASAIGKFFNPAQTELGPLNDAMMAFRNNTSFWLAILGVGAGLMYITEASVFLAAASASSVLMSAYSFVIPVVGGALMKFIGGFPDSVVRSSGSLRDAVLAHFGVRSPEGAVVGELEHSLSGYLQASHDIEPSSDVGLFRGVVDKCFPYVVNNPLHSKQDYTDILVRLKLTVLSSHLRTALKSLPIVLLTGPTRAGKSTLREHLQSRQPDRANFGPKATQRTSVPEVFLCGDAGRPICVLDSIGVGDPTKDQVLTAINHANKLFQEFCTASIIVVNEGDASAAGRALLQRTSDVPTRDEPAGERPSVQHPTMTCITNVDRIASDGVGGVFPVAEGGPAALLQDARHRVARGEPFDLRSPAESSFTPRVMACFESRIAVPEEYKGIVYTTDDIKDWLFSHFYHQRTGTDTA